MSSPRYLRKILHRSRLYDFRQIGSVQSYTQAFRELCFAIDDLSVAEKTTLYRRGLKAHILKDVWLRFPKTLEEAILIAESIDVVGGSPTFARPVRTGTGGRGALLRRPFQRGRGAGAALHAAGGRCSPRCSSWCTSSTGKTRGSHGRCSTGNLGRSTCSTSPWTWQGC